uniref:(northern house mosquito) hypothetical protein n=1 Tax=Culex pipiens TaxID=7175 RepID=A0A8D8G0G0_CULPI
MCTTMPSALVPRRSAFWLTTTRETLTRTSRNPTSSTRRDVTLTLDTITRTTLLSPSSSTLEASVVRNSSSRTPPPESATAMSPCSTLDLSLKVAKRRPNMF